MDLEAQTLAGAKNGAKADSPVVTDQKKKAVLEISDDSSSSQVEDDPDRTGRIVAAAGVLYNSLQFAFHPPGGFAHDGAAAGRPLLATTKPPAFEAFLTASLVAAMCSAAALLMLVCRRPPFVVARAYKRIAVTTLCASMVSLLWAITYLYLSLISVI